MAVVVDDRVIVEYHEYFTSHPFLCFTDPVGMVVPT